MTSGHVRLVQNNLISIDYLFKEIVRLTRTHQTERHHSKQYVRHKVRPKLNDEPRYLRFNSGTQQCVRVSLEQHTWPLTASRHTVPTVPTVLATKDGWNAETHICLIWNFRAGYYKIADIQAHSIFFGSLMIIIVAKLLKGLKAAKCCPPEGGGPF